MSDTRTNRIPSSRGPYLGFCLAALMAILFGATAATAQSCYTSSDMDPTTKAALDQAARRYFSMAVNQDFAGLKQSATASLASNFAPVESAVAENHANLQGGQPAVRSEFLLDASGSSGTLQRAEFYCGIFNSPDRVAFVIPNLPAGRYGLVIEDVQGGKAPITFALVLKDQGGNWALAGLTMKSSQVGGHEAQWFLDKARAFKAKGQNHDAWLYYLAGWDLQAPVGFMYTAQREKVADEMQGIRPEDLPGQGKPMPLSAGGKSYNVTQMFPEAVGSDLYLIVKYQTTDVSNTTAAMQDNLAVIRGMVTRYPELRDAFAGVVARAVEPSGRDYGTLLAMKDVK